MTKLERSLKLRKYKQELLVLRFWMNKTLHIIQKIPKGKMKDSLIAAYLRGLLRQAILIDKIDEIFPEEDSSKAKVAIGYQFLYLLNPNELLDHADSVAA